MGAAPQARDGRTRPRLGERPAEGPRGAAPERRARRRGAAAGRGQSRDHRPGTRASTSSARGHVRDALQLSGPAVPGRGAAPARGGTRAAVRSRPTGSRTRSGSVEGSASRRRRTSPSPRPPSSARSSARSTRGPGSFAAELAQDVAGVSGSGQHADAHPEAPRAEHRLRSLPPPTSARCRPTRPSRRRASMRCRRPGPTTSPRTCPAAASCFAGTRTTRDRARAGWLRSASGPGSARSAPWPPSRPGAPTTPCSIRPATGGVGGHGAEAREALRTRQRGRSRRPAAALHTAGAEHLLLHLQHPPRAVRGRPHREGPSTSPWTGARSPCTPGSARRDDRPTSTSRPACRASRTPRSTRSAARTCRPHAGSPAPRAAAPSSTPATSRPAPATARS